MGRMLTFGVHHLMKPGCSAEGGRLGSAKFLSRKSSLGKGIGK
jgi:hypothetical protein